MTSLPCFIWVLNLGAIEYNSYHFQFSQNQNHNPRIPIKKSTQLNIFRKLIPKKTLNFKHQFLEGILKKINTQVSFYCNGMPNTSHKKQNNKKYCLSFKSEILFNGHVFRIRLFGFQYFVIISSFFRPPILLNPHLIPYLHVMHENPLYPCRSVVVTLFQVLCNGTLNL